MRNMTNIGLGLFTALALVATGCQSAKNRDAREADANDRSTAEVIEEQTEDAAEGAEQAAADVDEAVTEDLPEEAREAAQRTEEELDELAGNEDEEIARETRQTRGEAEEQAEKAGKKAERAAGEVKEEAKQVGHNVTAEIARIDRDAKTVTFNVKDEAEEIQLQAGREMQVEFSRLEDLTGMSQEEALEKLEEGAEIDVEVAGQGDEMRVVRIDLDGKR